MLGTGDRSLRGTKKGKEGRNGLDGQMKTSAQIRCRVSLEFKSNRSRALATSSGNTKKIHRELIGPVSSNLTSFASLYSFFQLVTVRGNEPVP